jgi:hypothetical protein
MAVVIAADVTAALITLSVGELFRKRSYQIAQNIEAT